MAVIASCGEDFSINVWNIVTGDLLVTLLAHNNVVCVVRFSPCGTMLASCSFDGRVILWECDSWTKYELFVDESNEIVALSFDCTGSRLAFIVEGSVCIFNVIARSQESIFQTGYKNMFSLSFHPTDDVIAVTCDNFVGIYSAGDGTLRQLLVGHSQSVFSVEYGKYGNLLASGSDDYTAIVWDSISGSVIHQLSGHTGMVSQVSFNADASRLVSSSWDNTARIWDVSTGECLLTLNRLADNLFACIFSEDGSKVITGSDDKTVKVWDSYTGEELRTLIGHTGPILSVSYRRGSFI